MLADILARLKVLVQELEVELNKPQGDPPGKSLLELEASTPKRFCVWCHGEILYPIRADAKYCGTRCRVRYHRFSKEHAP
jgi:hypothetical protein